VIEGIAAGIAAYTFCGIVAHRLHLRLWPRPERRFPGEGAVVRSDAAVLTGVAGGTRLTRTFVRQGGRWLLAALHSSRAAGPP
jgi:hypothetical protein